MLLFVILSAVLLWRFILRASVYPKFIPTRTKIIHALILFFASVYAWSGCRQLAWLLFHTHADDWSSLSLVAGQLCWGLAGACLLFICFGMAIRRKNMVKWFFLFWPLTFLSGLFVTGIRYKAIAGITSAIQAGEIWGLVFLLTLAFYLGRSNKLLFEKVDHISTPEPSPTAP